MAQMSSAAARVVDPVLSNVVRGYRQGGFVGHLLFPRVDVTARGGKTIAFGKEDFVVYQTARAPGSNTKRVSVGYAGESYALTDHSLEGLLPIELQQEAQAVPGIDLGQRALRVPQRSLALELEVAQATIASNAGLYDSDHKITLTGADQWSDSSSEPGVQIRTYKDAVRQSIGVEPNVLILGAKAYSSLVEHDKVRRRFEYNSTDSITATMLAQYFEVATVAKASGVRYNPTTQKMVDIWGNVAVLAYVPPSPMGQEEPSYGYTYGLKGYPVVETPYYDANAKSWVYPYTDAWQVAMTSMLAGFLITNPAA